MEYPKKDIIKEITDLFEDYEETYVPGEWEEFSARKKKKYPFYMHWLSAAAAVLVISSVVFFSIKRDKGEKKEHVQFSTVKPAVPKITPVPVAPHKSAPVVSGIPAAAGQYASGPGVKDNKRQSGQRAGLLAVRQSGQRAGLLAVRQSGQRAGLLIVQHLPDPISVNGELVLASHQEGAAPGKDRRTPDTAFTGQKNQVIAKADVRSAVTNIPVPEKEVKPAKGKLSMMDFLAQESKAAEKASKKKDTRSKWDFGVQVMPSSTGSNVDLGGGVTTAYRISDRISVSSGVSLLQLQAGKDVASAPVQPNFAVAGFSSLSPEKKLTAVSSNIRAIDIPVGVIYKVSKSFYTSAGVSLFNVLSEKRNNTYYQTSQVDKMAINPETGYVSTYKSLQTTEVMENAVPGQFATGQDPVKQNTLGFFNFSIGRQQNIFDKYSIQIEPFIKVPLGKFSTENLNLLNSGIKFQLIF